MIEHILLLRWKDDASREAIDKAMAELRALKDQVPGIIDLSSGVNFSERAKGYTHGVVMRLSNRAALEAYYPHPEHQRVVLEYINPIRADILVLDYEHSR